MPAWRTTIRPSGNRGEQYRSTDVDIEACDEGGFDVGWVTTGEWLKYTVNVSQAGVYSLEFRVASKDRGGTFHLEVNGVDRTGPIQVNDTNGWQNWTTVTKSGVSLSAGSQVWRLVFDADTAGTVGNFNYIRVTGPASSGYVDALQRHACRASRARCKSRTSTTAGKGLRITISRSQTKAGSTAQQEWTSRPRPIAEADTTLATRSRESGSRYTVNVSSSGTYDIEVRAASGGAGGTFHIEVNGVNKTGAFTVPDTGGWQNWVTLRKTGLTLSGGQQVFKVVLDSNGPNGAVGNFNYLRGRRFRRCGSGGSGGSNAYNGTPVALPGTVQVETFDNGGEGVGYHDLSAAKQQR